MIINLPKLSFIYQPQGGWMITNTYSGSLGTDPEKGCRNREIFCFKISIIGDAEDPSIKAECYTQLANMDGTKNYDQAEMTAEPTADGLKIVNEWLDEHYIKYTEK